MKLSNSIAFKAIRKPQNQISEFLKDKIVAEIQEWFQGFGLVAYHARLLASELCDRAISERIQATSPTAPDVLLSDADKQQSLVMAAKRMADKLDQEEELDKLLDELVAQDALREGNS